MGCEAPYYLICKKCNKISSEITVYRHHEIGGVNKDDLVEFVTDHFFCNSFGVEQDYCDDYHYRTHGEVGNIPMCSHLQAELDTARSKNK